MRRGKCLINGGSTPLPDYKLVYRVTTNVGATVNAHTSQDGSYSWDVTDDPVWTVLAFKTGALSYEAVAFTDNPDGTRDIFFIAKEPEAHRPHLRADSPMGHPREDRTQSAYNLCTTGSGV